MKKFSLFICILFLIAILSSCIAGNRLYDRVSQLRYDVLYFEDDEIELTCFAETSEFPEENDGFVGQNANLATFKLFPKYSEKISEGATLEFVSDGIKHTVKFEFRPSAEVYYAKCEQTGLIGRDLTVKITVNGEQKTAVLTSLKRNDLIDYREIIKKLDDLGDEKVKSFLKYPDSAELKIRLLYSDGFNFWYVGIVREGETVNLLFDGLTGEHIETKITK